MTKKMLIDAAHPEETRVVIVDRKRVDEFDFEASARRQIRANIYLAKVTRVEPSLQAAFVEYGGNRHGFLAFNEIHPDYYQIPHDDRVALLKEIEDAAHSDDDPDDAAAAEIENGEDDDHDAAVAKASRAFMRKYKIQEVIRRRQILLVQVAKEERGNKGAALTTYLSLAGRYGVLMPNTARGGGISRKITSATDRKRLRKIVDDLDVPQGMGLIVRTAGAKRTKTEIKRDYDYLLRLWESIRNKTLTSIAPCLIHEESNLVKRAVRDMYDKDIEEIQVEGEDAYREAKDFIKMLMPSHAKKVQKHKTDKPIFLANGIESQLEEMYNPVAPLPSGGYLVINQTEALVAIDVNSGKSTKEKNVEATALKTNLEAAEEACRQFRLRDLAGLIVIDFIDMDENKNNRAVEKRMRDCLKRDRARIQVGKISGFGLMEMSRQRRRASIIEGSHVECAHCAGRGTIRTPSSSALHVLRSIEEYVDRHNARAVEVKAAPAVVLYVLNEKRHQLAELEARCNVRVSVTADDTLVPPNVNIQARALTADESLEEPAKQETKSERPQRDRDETQSHASGEEEGQGRRRRRRRGGRGRNQDAASDTSNTGDDVSTDGQAQEASSEPAEANADGPNNAPDAEDGDQPKRRRRRGRRGGRNRRGAQGETASDATAHTDAETDPQAGPGDSQETVSDDQTAPPAQGPAGMDVITPSDHDDAAPVEIAAEEASTATSPDAPSEPAPTNGAHPPLNGAEAQPATPLIETDDEDTSPGVRLDPAQTQPIEPDPDAENRRRRWQDRLKSWVNG